LPLMPVFFLIRQISMKKYRFRVDNDQGDH
jgi:hypothetical protein